VLDIVLSGRRDDRFCDAPGMYVSVTRVKTLDQPVENASVVGEEMLRWLSETEGFEGFLVLSREGTSLGLTFWESREMAERHRVARMQFLERVMSVVGAEIEAIEEYDLSFAQVGPLVAGFSG
jgi:hypothetical protein